MKKNSVRVGTPMVCAMVPAIDAIHMTERSPVLLEVPRWFHRRRGAREALREKVEGFLDKGRRKFVIHIEDTGRFVSMDVGVLLGVVSMVRSRGGAVAIATANKKFHELPHPSVDEGLLRFQTVDEARDYVIHAELPQRDSA